MAERRDVPRETNRLVEAFIELARSAAKADRDAEEQRRSIHVVGSKGGKAA